MSKLTAALFACTKCLKKYPLDDLSQDQQLCKECRDNFPVVKCTYCRTEFQQEDKSSTSTICRKCAYYVKVHGKPKPCDFCNIIAAFGSSKCQRCTASTKKYGLPKICEQCKQQCAFERPDYQQMSEGKLLCWLCMQSYKRALAKAKDTKRFNKTLSSLSSRSGSHRSNSKDPTALLREKAQQDAEKCREAFKSSKAAGSSSRGKLSGSSSNKLHPSSSLARISSNKTEDDKDNIFKSKSPRTFKNSSDDLSSSVTSTSPFKKPRLDQASPSNGTFSSPGASSTLSMFDPVGSDHIVVISQLKEQITSLQKQLQQKDQQLLEKDKKMTELKAGHYEAERSLRNKLQTMQHQSESNVDDLLGKNRTLTKQLGQLNKAVKLSEKLNSRSNSPILSSLKLQNNSQNNSPSS